MREGRGKEGERWERHERGGKRTEVDGEGRRKRKEGKGGERRGEEGGNGRKLPSTAQLPLAKVFVSSLPASTSA